MTTLRTPPTTLPNAPPPITPDYAYMLRKHGFRQSTKKRNVFYKKSPNSNLVFFANLNGYPGEPTTPNPKPTLSARFPDQTPDWQKRRLLNEQLQQLKIARFHYTLTSGPNPLNPIDGPDGHCLLCGTDHGSDRIFCSPHCEIAFFSVRQIKCTRCGRSMAAYQAIDHHIQYNPPKTIKVCKSCHYKIEILKDYPYLLATDPQNSPGNHKRRQKRQPPAPTTNKARSPPD